MGKPIPDIWTTPRAVRGYCLSLLAQGLIDLGVTNLPVGGARPVFIATGLFGTQASTNQLRRVLRKQDFNARRLNVDFHLPSKHPDFPYGMEFGNGVQELYVNTGQPVDLIGWSLGGLAAAVYAHRHPEQVRGLYTLASPLKRTRQSSHLILLEQLFECTGRHGLTEDIEQLLEDPLPVPHYAYIANQDEIVDPKCCVGEHSRYYDTGHLEIGFSPFVYADLIRDISQNSSCPRQNHPLETLRTTLDSLCHSL